MQEFSHPITSIGTAHRKYGDLKFGISQPDRLLHMYVIGQTGTGKSVLLQNMALQDAKLGNGFCLIDPHGDLAAELTASIKRDHIYWTVADPACPYGYNPLTNTSAAYRPLLASGLIETLKKQWADAWGARMEHLLRYAILALLEQPRTDFRDIMRLFIDKDFQRAVLARVTDPQVRQFWEKEYKALNLKTAMDGVAPIANKLGAFLAHPVIRKALCEPDQPLRFRQLMDEGKIIIINLSKGQIGADVANVLGGLIVSSITNAAFSRHSIPEENRTPFMLYVDEFHNFSTTAFASALSEVRKYGLGLILAHQHLQQTDGAVLEAVMGNVGTMVVLRIGVLDAPLISQQFEDLTNRDLTSQPNHRAYVKLMVQGTRSRGFSSTLHPPQTSI